MKIFLVSLVFIFSFTANGQTDKGTWLIGGNGNFLHSKMTYTGAAINQVLNKTDIEISPNIGYFIIDKLAIGLKVGFSKFKEQNPNGGYSNVNRFDLGPFLRYYFLDREKNYNLLADVNYQYGISKFTSTLGNFNTFSVSAGTVIFFNTSIGLEFLLGYYQRKENVYGNYKTTQNGFQSSIGFHFHLEK